MLTSPTPSMQATAPSSQSDPIARATASPVLTNPASTAPVPVTMTYTFGAHRTAVQSVSRRRVIQDAAYTGYTSTAAPISISINVTPIGGSTSSYTGSCTATATGTSGTCTVTFTASPGATAFAGTLMEAGNTVASFSQTQIVTPGSANTISFTANPVVNSVTIGLGSTALNGGTAASVPIIVTAYDANGSIIAGKQPYVDANGNAVSLSMRVVNRQAGGRGTVALRGPVRISAPGQALTYASYDGKWLASADILLTSTSNLIASPTAATLAITPYVQEYPSGVSWPFLITSGPDGKLWYTAFNSSNIGSMSTDGTSYGPYAAPSNTFSIATGPDGNLWFSCFYGNNICKSTTSGLVTSVISTTGGFPVTVVAGPDGNLWYTNNNTSKITKLSTSGMTASYATTIATKSFVFGPDGSIWIVPYNGTSLQKMSQNGVILGTYTIPANGIDSDQMTVGPNGNIWFPNYASNLIEKSDSNGNVIDYSLTGNAKPVAIVTGPDGSMWFTETGTSKIGRLTTSGSLQEWGNGSNGITAGAAPWGIAVGSDGNIWFTEKGTNRIGRLVY